MNMMLAKETDYPSFYKTYVDLAPGENIPEMLEQSLSSLRDFLQAIPQSNGDHSYAEGKWTVKQVVQHCIDTERVFAYRALCHARGEKQSLPGFSQNEYAEKADTTHRSLAELVEEMILVRQTSVILFNSLTPADLERTSSVGGNPIKTCRWAQIIAGHFIHHKQILISKYGIEN